MHFEATARSIAKTVSYRISATLVTAIVVRVLTGSTSLALFAGYVQRPFDALAGKQLSLFVRMAAFVGVKPYRP